MSANDTCVVRRMFKSRIAARMAFSAVGLTADSDEAARLKRDDCAQGFLDDAAPL